MHVDFEDEREESVTPERPKTREYTEKNLVKKSKLLLNQMKIL